MLTFGSLFSGIGGLDLGLERAGMTCLWQSEIDPYASRVLKKHWPNTPNLGDINEIDWRTVPAVDLICGGYPCQPFSIAGQRNGTDDDRHLWPRFADAIRTLRPRFALLENVTGHLSLGFGDVQADLAACGYDTQWDCIPAATVGAPHLRDRIFVIAERRTVMANTDSNSVGSYGATGELATQSGGGHFVRRRETQLASGQPWADEPRMGRMADGVSNRVDRCKALGNAVVPQVAQYVGEIIMDMATN